MRPRRRRRRHCPHCGNHNPKTIEDNGRPPTSPHLTLICIARVKPEDCAFDHVKPSNDDFDAEGKVPCGMQWDPNDHTDDHHR